MDKLTHNDTDNMAEQAQYNAARNAKQDKVPIDCPDILCPPTTDRSHTVVCCPPAG
jgi:tRNA1(Val) A37 N6-methylase TrmN6